MHLPLAGRSGRRLQVKAVPGLQTSFHSSEHQRQRQRPWNGVTVALAAGRAAGRRAAGLCRCQSLRVSPEKTALGYEPGRLLTAASHFFRLKILLRHRETVGCFYFKGSTFSPASPVGVQTSASFCSSNQPLDLHGAGLGGAVLRELSSLRSSLPWSLLGDSVGFWGAQWVVRAGVELNPIRSHVTWPGYFTSVISGSPCRAMMGHFPRRPPLQFKSNHPAFSSSELLLRCLHQQLCPGIRTEMCRTVLLFLLRRFLPPLTRDDTCPLSLYPCG